MPRPDYSGSWRFNRGASRLQIACPDAVTFTIVHRDAAFRLERTLTFGDRPDTFAIDLIVGAEECFRGPSLNYDNLWVFRREQVPPAPR